jgi:Uma2 family endonuclease
MRVQLKRKTHTPEVYLALEEKAEFRSEYHDGEIVAMTGGTPNHNKIAGNLYAPLNFAFRGKPHQIFMSDLRLWVPAYRRFTYPDIMVVEGELELLEGRRDTITNPVLITEVLSDSTEAYDRGEKFRIYRSLASFREYLLISQNAMRVERFVKNAQGQWLLVDYEGADATLELSAVPFEAKLSDIYDKVTFEAPDKTEYQKRQGKVG